MHWLQTSLEEKILVWVNNLSLSLSCYRLSSCWQSQAALGERAAINRGITFTSPVKTDSFCVWVVDIFLSVCDHDQDSFVSPAQTSTPVSSHHIYISYLGNIIQQIIHIINLTKNGLTTGLIYIQPWGVFCTSSAIRQTYRELFCHTTNLTYSLPSNSQFVLSNLFAPAHFLPTNELPELSKSPLQYSCQLKVSPTYSFCVWLLPDS